MDRAAPRPVPPGQLLPLPHTAYGGLPYFDEELQVPQLDPHRIMVFETGSILELIAGEVGLRFVSDHPIWYLDPDLNVQRAYYGDWVIARDVDIDRITARDLRLVVEVVSTNDRRKEIKDTVFQRALNESNEVPEFGLVFPDAEDPRALHWYILDGGRYRELIVSPGGQVDSRVVPGLTFQVRPQAEWSDGRKLDVLFRGELRPPLAVERQRAEDERRRAEDERKRAEEALEEIARLKAKLEKAGIEPE